MKYVHDFTVINLVRYFTSVPCHFVANSNRKKKFVAWVSSVVRERSLIVAIAVGSVRGSPPHIYWEK